MDEELQNQVTEGADGQSQGHGADDTPQASPAKLSAFDRYQQLAKKGADGDEGDDNDEEDAGDLADNDAEPDAKLADGKDAKDAKKEPAKQPSVWDKLTAKFGGEKKKLADENRTLRARDSEREIVLRAAQRELAVYRQALVEAGLLDENASKLRGFQFRDDVSKQIADARKKREKADAEAAKKATEEEAAAKKHAEDVEAIETDVAAALKAHPGLTREALIAAAMEDTETAIADIAKKIAPKRPRQQPTHARKPAGAGTVKKHPKTPDGAWARYQELAGGAR